MVKKNHHETNFAIRCPHCQKWLVQDEKHPKEVAISSKAELEHILKLLERAISRREGDTFFHEKLFRCESPPWICPTSFEAFVCRNRKDTLEFFKVTKAYSFKRAFRLYKRKDCEDRWEEYHVILLCTQPIQRLPNIELESLMNRELLSRLIAGISIEIYSPLTIFTANIFEPKGKDPEELWMPVEGYPGEKQLVPPHYNKFCECCRNIVMTKLIKEFEDRKISANKCPISFGKNGKCAGKEAACIHKPEKDWNHCPAFIKERKQRCPCYSSDHNLIEKVKNKWPEGESTERKLSRCYAGFTEIAFPIEVHGHLVGIAMTGQMFFNKEEIADVNDFLSGKSANKAKSWDLLQGSEKKLEEAKQNLIEENQGKEGEPRFMVTKDELDNRIELSEKNIERIQDMAESRYHDFRGRSEFAFRQEVLWFIENQKREMEFFNSHILRLLERMREFWAFEAVYLVEYSLETKDISVVSFDNIYRKGKSFGTPGKKLGSIEIECLPIHPSPYLHRMDQPFTGEEAILEELVPIFEQARNDPELEIPIGEYYFFALIPFLEKVYAFIFTVRDDRATCNLKHRVTGGVSKLCQDVILETCTQVIYGLSDIWYNEVREKGIRDMLSRQYKAQCKAEAAFAKNRSDWIKEYKGKLILVRKNKVIKSETDPHKLWDALNSYTTEQRYEIGIIQVPLEDDEHGQS